MRGIAALLVALSCCLTLKAQPPNIVFILVDDLGWGDLSCFGQENWATPRLDRMASEGMRFTQAYSGSTVCAPSRGALLIGKHTGRLHMRGNGDIEFQRDPEDLTIATLLRRSGYRTAMIGKSSVACHSDDTDLPHDKGFDHFFGVLSHRTAHRQYPRELVRNRSRVSLERNDGKTGDTYANSLYVDDAVDWIASMPAEQPFFLHLSLTPPHADLIAPERYMEPFRGRFPEQPVTTSGYYHQPEPRAAYAGMIAFLDESVGRVLDALVDRGIDGRTVVFFASDNGPHSEGGGHPDVFDSNGPFRGGKRALFEGGIRTPLIVRWPGHIPAGSSSDMLTAFWDFPSTAMDLAGGPPLEDTDGVSILPTLLGREHDQEHHAFLYWEFHEQGGKQAVRIGDWKGIRRDVGRMPDGPIELYDLSQDPGEKIDVSAHHPNIVDRIRQVMAASHHPSAIFRFSRVSDGE